MVMTVSNDPKASWCLFLSMEVARSEENKFILQRKYTLDILDEMKMLGCRSVKRPMEANYKLGLKKKKPPPPIDKERY